jgi:hypothetical protein
MVRPTVDSTGRLIKFHLNMENIVNTFNLNNLYSECKSDVETVHKKNEPRTQAEKSK